jgi:prophage regulatory protein
MAMSNTNPFWLEIEPSGRLLRPSEVITITGLSRSQIYQMISDGTFPPFLKLSERASALPEAWLNAFISRCAAATISKRNGFREKESCSV